MRLFLAHFESSNFEFVGCGTTEKQAKSALLRALRYHCNQRGAILKEFYYADEVFIQPINAGDGFIDKEKVCES